MKKPILTLLFITLYGGLTAQTPYDLPGAGNPVIPGYFADPTVRKFGDKYYLYATTDGNGGGHGPSQVWISENFTDWVLHPMNWPTTPYYWAPDVLEKDGKYYLYYCQPCMVYCGVSDHPAGPWSNILGDDQAVLIPDRYVRNAITLDAQTFMDDDGEVYLYWGTWGIYPDHGCGAGRLAPDMCSLVDTLLIPNTDATDFFEAPFVFKRDGIYYLMYSSGSCHNETYRVQYATSRVGPLGPFEFADNNPILATNADGTVHGPGHHCIWEEDGEYYIMYHRHNIPYATRGMHRQIAVDRLRFDAEGRICKIEPTHQGVVPGDARPMRQNRAFGRPVTASSYYSDQFRPEYAVNDNFATLWRPATTGEEWITIDVGEIMPVRRVWLQFEYPTCFYQYLIETSTDNSNWLTFADRRDNTAAGSPMAEYGDTQARYVRVTVSGTEYNGMFGALWNIRVFPDDDGRRAEFESIRTSFTKPGAAPAPARKGLLVDVDAAGRLPGCTVHTIDNKAPAGGSFAAEGKPVLTVLRDGVMAYELTGDNRFGSTFGLPETLTGNAPYTISAWVYNPKASVNEWIADLNDAGGELEKVMLGTGADPASGIVCHYGVYEDLGIQGGLPTERWMHLAVTFDGYMEKVYLDGEKIAQKDIVLRLPAGNRMFLGGNSAGNDGFTGALASFTLWDIPLSAAQIQTLAGKRPGNQGILADGSAFYPEATADSDRMVPERTVQASKLSCSGEIPVRLPAGSVPAAVMLDFFAGNRPVRLLRTEDFTVDYEPRKSRIVIRQGKDRSELPVSPENQGRWNTMAVNFRSGNLRLNGMERTARWSGSPSLTGLRIGDKRSYIGQFLVLDREVTAQEAELWQDPSGGIGTTALWGRIHPLSPNDIVLIVEVEHPEVRLNYRFTNRTTGQCSGWIKSAYFRDAAPAQGKNHYEIAAADARGNCHILTDTILYLDTMDFCRINDTFTKNWDYSGTLNPASAWKKQGFDSLNDTKAEVSNGCLTLGSASRSVTADNRSAPAHLYVEARGDFVAELEIAGFSGGDNHRPVGHNEGGLMVSYDAGQGKIGAMHLGVFPFWNIGNLLTDLTPVYRNQYPAKNGWEYGRFLRVERCGDWFFFSTSMDGLRWEPMPSCPLHYPQLSGMTLRIGPYQATYTDHYAEFWFRRFTFSQIKKQHTR